MFLFSGSRIENHVCVSGKIVEVPKICTIRNSKYVSGAFNFRHWILS